MAVLYKMPMMPSGMQMSGPKVSNKSSGPGVVDRPMGSAKQLKPRKTKNKVKKVFKVAKK